MKTSKNSTSAFACLFVGIALSLNTTKSIAQTIPTDSVMNYIGKTVKVCDKVYGTRNPPLFWTGCKYTNSDLILHRYSSNGSELCWRATHQG